MAFTIIQHKNTTSHTFSESVVQLYLIFQQDANAAIGGIDAGAQSLTLVLQTTPTSRSLTNLVTMHVCIRSKI